MATCNPVSALETTKQLQTVSQFSQSLQKNLQEALPFSWITGELCSVFTAQSGHVYATIKDNQSQLKIVIYQFVKKDILFDIKDGLHVNIGVQPAVYKPRGELQLIVKRMEPEGIGALQLAFEQTKAKLEAEGLFNQERKRKLPLYPKGIGVITSKDGAVWHDIFQVIKRRYPIVPIFLYSCSVQGPQSIEEIVHQLKKAGQEGKADVYILARGGGSLSDLWSFNTEAVVRALYEFPYPIISAVGHETDYTLADLVADIRAATPSIAAELATPELKQILSAMDGFSAELEKKINIILRQLEYQTDKIEQQLKSKILGIKPLNDRLQNYETLWPRLIKSQLNKIQQHYNIQTNIFQHFYKKNTRFIADQSQHIKQKNTLFLQLMTNYIQNTTKKLLSWEKRFQELDPKKTQLSVFVSDHTGNLITSSKNIKEGMLSSLHFADGVWDIQFIKLKDSNK